MQKIRLQERGYGTACTKIVRLIYCSVRFGFIQRKNVVIGSNIRRCFVAVEDGLWLKRSSRKLAGVQYTFKASLKFEKNAQGTF